MSVTALNGKAAADKVLAVLGYHKIGEPSAGNARTWFYVSESAFAEQLAYLRDNDWTVLDLSAFLRGLADPARLPKRSAVVTFDDGYRSVHDRALPVLQQFECPAVMFVPTAFVGATNSFDGVWEPHEPICDWHELRALRDAGVAIQSHGVSHRRFSELTPDEQETELLGSRLMLEAELEEPVEVFAYPYGDAGTDVAGLRSRLENTGYRAACLFRRGPDRIPVTDPFLLNRVPVGSDTEFSTALMPR